MKLRYWLPPWLVVIHIFFGDEREKHSLWVYRNQLCLFLLWEKSGTSTSIRITCCHLRNDVQLGSLPPFSAAPRLLQGRGQWAGEPSCSTEGNESCSSITTASTQNFCWRTTFRNLLEKVLFHLAPPSPALRVGVGPVMETCAWYDQAWKYLFSCLWRDIRKVSRMN